MENYKEEILNSRVGNLGASDGALLAKVAQTQSIPNSAIERLAIVKGLKEPIDGFKSDAMLLGDKVEMEIYKSLVASDNRWQSNFLLRSQKFSKKNVSLIAHIDFFKIDEETKTLNVVECKATTSTTENTYYTYKPQLFIEYVLAKEYAASLGRGWSVKMQLCHYDTNDFDGEINPDKINFKACRFATMLFDLDLAMDIVDRYLETMDEYCLQDTVNADMLPMEIQKQFTMMATILTEIKTREALVDEFKQKLYEFMNKNGIKSLKNDVFSITRVDPTTVESFDHKKYLEDYSVKYPRKYKKLCEQYKKLTNKKGYVNFKLK